MITHLRASIFLSNRCVGCFMHYATHSEHSTILTANLLDAGIEKWPRRRFPATGGSQYSWSNIGFPEDESLIVNDFEQDTHIDKQTLFVAELTQDITDIRMRAAGTIADGGLDRVETSLKHGRIIETFKVRGHSVCKIRIQDADIYAAGAAYSGCKIAIETEKEIDSVVGGPPSLEMEQWVASQLLLSRGGQIGGRTQDYFTKARDLAQQQLHLNPGLESKVREEQRAGHADNDAAFTNMLSLVRQGFNRSKFNPYHQSRRDDYAVEKDILHHVMGTDIVMALDKSDNVIFFQCSDAFDKLLGTHVERQVAKSLETFSTLQPVPIPDMTRHGLHWIDWLAEHPEFDFRVPGCDPRTAKSGVYHWGGRCETGDPSGKKKPNATLDSQERNTGKNKSHIQEQLLTLRYSALGACTELVAFFFNILDPELLAEYRKVAQEVASIKVIPFETRRTDEPFVLRAALVNLMTNEHKDRSDWRNGFAGLVPVGDFQGGDMILRELGLRIQSRPGCVQLLRGRELRHSITRWTGRRFVVVNATHQAVRSWAQRRWGQTVDSAKASSDDTCLGADQEDVVPEDERDLSLREQFPETYEPDSMDDMDSDAESEASVGQVTQVLRQSHRGSKKRVHSSSDALPEQDEK